MWKSQTQSEQIAHTTPNKIVQKVRWLL